MLQLPKPAKRHHFTPLRYPGGKTILYEMFARIIDRNKLHSFTYVEPYAGGAGAGLALLLNERVSSIVINDLDRSVYAFWWSILNETKQFLDRLASVPVDITEWRRQGATFRDPSANLLDLGFATFFLNRTNHSGILSGGPIGGLDQLGRFKLDARFNRDELIRRIRTIARYHDRIEVLNMDGLELIEERSSSDGYLFYVDPPYFGKGALLYLNAYKSEDHSALARVLNHHSQQYWILSYDDTPQIRQLYQQRPSQLTFALHYQAHSSRIGSELMVLSDAVELPDDLEFCQSGLV